MKHALSFVAVAVFLACLSSVRADPDLPGPASNVRTVKAGSYIIPMDNNKQTISNRFNFKAYGLVVKLLYSNVPVYWIIRVGKGIRSVNEVTGAYSLNYVQATKDDGIDFTAKARKVYPATLAADQYCTSTNTTGCLSYQFSGGPFVIEKFQVTLAIPVLDASKAAGENVQIYELMVDTAMDIRHTLTQKPFTGVLNSGGYWGIPKKYCDLMGLVLDTHYSVMSIAAARGIGGNVCVTIATEPHFESTDPAFKDNMYMYLNSGGNFLAHCAAINTYELSGGTISDNGIKFFGSTSTTARSQIMTYMTPDLPYLQIDGPVPGSNGGLVETFRLNTNGYDTSRLPSGVTQSRFINNAHSVIQHTNPYFAAITPTPAGIDKNPPDIMYAAHAKLARDAVGGNIYYLGTHDFTAGSSILYDNGVRLYLNAVLTPATRPASCGFTIQGCPSVLCDHTWETPDDQNSCVCTCQPTLYQAAVDATPSACASPLIPDVANCACLNPSESGFVAPSASPKTKGKKAPDEIASPPPIEVKDTKSNDALIGGVVGAVVGTAACLGLAAFLLARKNKKEKEEYEKACAEGELALGGTAENPLFKEFAQQRQNPLFENDHCIDL